MVPSDFDKPSGVREARPIAPPPFALIEQSQATGPSALMRLWLWMPDWVFRAAGAIFFFAYAFVRMGEYREFPRIGPWWSPIIGTDAAGAAVFGPRQYFPAAKILVDLTFLLIALSFCFRRLPRRRADTGRQIVIPLLGGFWPLLPFMLLAALKAADSPWRRVLENMLSLGQIGLNRFYAGALMMAVGNALDVWGYATLLRSLSIVAEARELRLAGPYRFVRHPIYLGQFIAQAGHWLVLVRPQPIWFVFFAVFVAMQLYRARVEEDVLERAFGETYQAYKRRTFWFL